jgi:hypothetical protein
MIQKTKIFPFNKDKILSKDRSDLVSYIKGLLGSLTRAYEDIARELTPTYEEVLVWQPSSLADGASTSSGDINVPGAECGDYVQVSAPYDLEGLIYSGYIRAPDIARIVLFNKTGNIVTLNEGEWTVKVTKRK